MCIQNYQIQNYQTSLSRNQLERMILLLPIRNPHIYNLEYIRLYTIVHATYDASQSLTIYVFADSHDTAQYMLMNYSTKSVSSHLAYTAPAKTKSLQNFCHVHA